METNSPPAETSPEQAHQERMAQLNRAIKVENRIGVLLTMNTILSTAAFIVLILLSLEQFSKLKENQSVIKQNQQIIKAQTCLIAKSTVIEVQATKALFDAFAKHFGVHVDFPELPPPSDNLHCKPTGGDDVFLGSNKSNHISGTSNADFMAGYAGNDTIIGEGGDDTEFGGKGRDHMWGSAGSDILHGDDGNDVLNARLDDHAKDFLDGGTGDDTCYVNSGDKTTNCEHVHKVN